MLKSLRYTASVLFLLPMLAFATEPVSLSEDTYKSDMGVILVQVNWGRTWQCGKYENAQIEALTFTKSPIDSADSVSLELETPSKLFVDNTFLPYALVVQPGRYILTAFDIKLARSTTDIVHINPSKKHLIKNGTPIGGSFTVRPGEIVYIGHFGLDCGAEPFLWRYYLGSRSEFEKYIRGFRQKFSFIKNVPVEFRLFSTKVLGYPFSLEEPVVK